MSNKKLYQSILAEERELIFLKYCIINIDNAKKAEEELFNKGIYLPNLLRNVLSRNYFEIMENKNVSDKIISSLIKSHTFNREESVNEFIDWVEENPDYEYLLNKKELKLLNNELRELKEYG